MSSQKPSGVDNNGLGGSTDTLTTLNNATVPGKEGSTTAVPKAIIKNVDMSDEMQQISVDIALEALNKFTVEKDIAAHVKKTMDTRFGPTWHAVVGQKYGSYVTHGELLLQWHEARYTFETDPSPASRPLRDQALHLLL